MARLTDIQEITNPAPDDLIHIVDVDDTSENAAGSSRAIQVQNLIPEAVGQGVVAPENLIINPDFTVNQRGGTKTPPVGNYGYDRWKGHANGLEQVVEYTGPMQNMTLSWVGGGNGEINGSSGASPLTASVPAATNISVVVPSTSTQVVLNAGDTPIVYVSRHPQVELALCQWYYVRYQGAAIGNRILSNGMASSTTSAHFTLDGVWMRLGNPANVNWTGLELRDSAARAIQSITINAFANAGVAFLVTVASGLGNGDAVQLRDTIGGGYIEFDSEL